MIYHHTARATQFVSWPITFIFFNSLFKLRIYGGEKLQNIPSPFIVISNHISMYDSFVFRVVLGLFTNKLPLRFMAVKKFENQYLNILSSLWIIDILYTLFGVVVVEPGRGIDKNLERAQKIIHRGGNMVIFPEGSVIKDGNIAPFKAGAAVLAQKTSASVIPIALRFGKKGFWRREFIINIGDVIEVDENLSSEEINNMFYEKIVDLNKRG